MPRRCICVRSGRQIRLAEIGTLRLVIAAILAGQTHRRQASCRNLLHLFLDSTELRLSGAYIGDRFSAFKNEVQIRLKYFRNTSNGPLTAIAAIAALELAL